MISQSKPRYACRLMFWYTPDPLNPGLLHAVVIRKDTHKVLGPPTGKVTLTSQVLRIDTKLKAIETLNSVYLYGG